MTNIASNIEQLSIQEPRDFELVKFIIKAEEKLSLLNGKVDSDINYVSETSGTLICDLAQPLNWDKMLWGLRELQPACEKGFYVMLFQNGNLGPTLQGIVRIHNPRKRISLFYLYGLLKYLPQLGYLHISFL